MGLRYGIDLTSFEAVWWPRNVLEFEWLLAGLGSFLLVKAAGFGSWLLGYWSGVPGVAKSGSCRNKTRDSGNGCRQIYS